MNTPTLYGIPACDTVKKARAWLQAQGVTHTFHDFKKLGVPEPQLAAWVAAVGWQSLLNRQGSTWRQLSEAEKAAVTDAGAACELMRRHSSVIKRPVVHWADGAITVGFSEALFAQHSA